MTAGKTTKSDVDHLIEKEILLAEELLVSTEKLLCSKEKDADKLKLVLDSLVSAGNKLKNISKGILPEHGFDARKKYLDRLGDSLCSMGGKIYLNICGSTTTKQPEESASPSKQI